MKQYGKSLSGFVLIIVLLLPVMVWGLSLEGQVKEYRLKNGMKVLVLERFFAPVVSLYIRFKVGAVDEAEGETGTAHLLEHMLFKGTETLGTKNYGEEKKILTAIDDLAGQIDGEMQKGDKADQESIAAWREQLQALQREHKEWVIKDEVSALYSQNGAEGLNASTGYDITTYKVSLPSNRIELWASIESDRMATPVFREFYSERDVVAEEPRRRTETQPWGKLYEELTGTAYLAHPYGYPTIGWMSDIQSVTVEMAEEFFETYYGPNNAVCAIVGDIDIEETKALIRRYFGPIPRREEPPPVLTEEPEQKGERKTDVV